MQYSSIHDAWGSGYKETFKNNINNINNINNNIENFEEKLKIKAKSELEQLKMKEELEKLKIKEELEQLKIKIIEEERERLKAEIKDNEKLKDESDEEHFTMGCNLSGHINKCKKCKEQFLNIFRENFSNSDKNITQVTESSVNETNINIFGFKCNLSFILKIIFVLLILIILYLIISIFNIKNTMNQKYLQKYLHNNLYMLPNNMTSNKMFKLIDFPNL